MKKTIEQLAEEYADNTIGFSNENNHLLEPCKRDFIAGHNAKSEGMVSKGEVVELIKSRLSIHESNVCDGFGRIANEAIVGEYKQLLTLINDIK